MKKQQEERPGDLILDHYLPNASKEERELARERFREYALHLIRIGKRIRSEQR